MSAIDLTFEHGRTLPEARAQLERAVAEATGVLGSFVLATEWNPDRTAARIRGNGFHVDIQVDATHVRVQADLPLLGRFLMPAVKGVLEKAFQKKLPG